MFSSFDPVYNILEHIQGHESIFDTLGFLAPFLLFGFSVWNLRTQTYYLGAYVIGWFANSLLNHILKQTIKEPRPTNTNTKALGYGMPSAHTQSCFFSIAYFYAVNHSTAFLIGELFLGALAFYQRWKTKMHTVEQLGVGSVVGIGFALFVYHLAYRFLHDYRDNTK